MRWLSSLGKTWYSILLLYWDQSLIRPITKRNWKVSMISRLKFSSTGISSTLILVKTTQCWRMLSGQSGSLMSSAIQMDSICAWSITASKTISMITNEQIMILRSWIWWHSQSRSRASVSHTTGKSLFLFSQSPIKMRLLLAYVKS